MNDVLELKQAAFDFADYVKRREAEGLEATFQIVADPNVENAEWEFPEDDEAILYCHPSREQTLRDICKRMG